MPIIVDLKIPFCPRLEDNPIKFPFCTHENIAWDKVTDYMKTEYREDLDDMSLELLCALYAFGALVRFARNKLRRN